MVVNLMSMQCDFTPLHYASFAGHLDICKFLVIECGCDPSVEADVSNTVCNVHNDMAVWFIVQHYVVETG